MLLPGALHAQSQQRVTLEMRGATMEQAITQIKETTRYNFFYRVDDLPTSPARDYAFRNATIESVMDELVRGTDLQWSFANGMIQITKRPAQADRSGGQVRGTVVGDDGQPLVGAAVMVVGTNRGESTDAGGHFVIDRISTPNVTLRISYLGRITREVTVERGSDTRIVLDTDVAAIEDVVVTGYQTLSRERATGAFSTVTESQLRDKPQANLMDRLEGMAAGLMIYGSDVTIRGVTTLETYEDAIDNSALRGRGGMKNPLIVVDGFIWDDLGGLNSIVSDNIQNVMVLKDAAAASIYGARSANGVIVVTTKSGRAGKTHISARAQYGFTSVPSRSGRDILSNSDMIDLQLELYNEYGSQMVADRRYGGWPDAMDLAYRRDIGAISDAQYNAEIARMRTADNGNQLRDYLLAPQKEQVYSFNISGGSERNTFYISGEYIANGNRNYERGVGSDLVRVNIKDNLRINRWLTATVGAIASYSNSYGVTSNALSIYANEPSWRMLTDSEGNTVAWNEGKSQEENERLIALGLKDEKYNPLADKRINSRSEHALNLRLNGSLHAQIAEGLDFSVMYEQGNTSGKTKAITAENSSTMSGMINNAAQVVGGNITYNIPLGAQLNEVRNTLTSHTLRGQLSFDRTFGDRHAVSAILGGERHKAVEEFTYARRYGYNDKTLNWVMIDAKTLASRITGTESVRGEFLLSDYDKYNRFEEIDDRFVSLYGNAGYTYDNRYTVTGSLRWDDSNLFGAKYRSVPLWSVGASWNVNNEHFFNVPFIDMLRVRMTYGINGNVPRGSSGSYMVVQSGINNTLGAPYHRITNPPNDELTWEKTTTINAGVDFALFRNRVNVSWDYYDRETDNMLGDVMADPTFGWSSVQRNYGRMRNHGTELTLNTVNVRSRAFEWRSTLVFSYNKNKLVESYVSNPTIYSYLYGYNMEGYAISPVFSFRYAGISDEGEPLVYDLTEEGEWVEANNTSDYNALVYGGTLRPTFNGSFTNTFSYKGLSLSFMFIFNGGHVTRKAVVPYMANDFGIFTTNIHKNIANRWQKTGDENKPGVTPAIGMTNNIYGSMAWNYRDDTVIKADYLCLRNITLSYDIPARLTDRIGIGAVRAYMQVQNAGLWTRSSDNTSHEGMLIGGVSGLERRATWLFGLNINL